MLPCTIGCEAENKPEIGSNLAQHQAAAVRTCPLILVLATTLTRTSEP